MATWKVRNLNGAYCLPKSASNITLVPDAAVTKEAKDRAFDRAIKFLNDTYSMHGWAW
jgi:hypothetical protein